MILKLSKPVDIDGELKKEIEYDFDNLTGESVENAIRSMSKMGYVPSVQEVDTILNCHLFSEAAGIDYLDVKRFSAKDYLKAAGEARNFFLAESEDLPQENTSEQ